MNGILPADAMLVKYTQNYCLAFQGGFSFVHTVFFMIKSMHCLQLVET